MGGCVDCGEVEAPKGVGPAGIAWDDEVVDIGNSGNTRMPRGPKKPEFHSPITISICSRRSGVSTSATGRFSFLSAYLVASSSGLR